MLLYDLERYDLALNAGMTDLTTLSQSYYAIPSLPDIITKNKIDKAVLLAATKQLIETNAATTDQAITLYNTILAAEDDNLRRMQWLKRDIASIYFALRNAQAVDANVATYTSQINLDFLDKNLMSSLNAIISSNGTIIGTATQPVSSPDNYENVSLDSYTESKVTVSLVDTYSTTLGYISDVAAVNTNTPFTIGAQTPIYTPSRSFEILFDREALGEINQVDMSLTQAHLIELHSSHDGITYTPLFANQVYIKKAIIPFPGNDDRWFKVIIYKNSSLSSVLQNGFYNYTVGFNYLFLSRLAVSDIAEFITNNIDPGITSVTGFSINTTDNYDDKNVNISYYIDFNNEDNWREIKPAGKKNIQKRAVKSFINVSDYYTNKLIELDTTLMDLTKTTEGKPVIEYDFNLEQDFLDSNQIRVFGNSLTDVDSTWNQVGNYWQIIGILNEAKTIPVYSNNQLFLNGVQVYGDPDNDFLYSMGPGVYQIQVDSGSYQYLFNKSVYTVISISSSGVYTLQDKQGNVITVTDSLYPHNLKENVENTFDFLFKSELVENQDFYVYNNPTDNTNKIRTFAQWNNLYLSYRLFASDITGLTLRIKATYQSLDNITIPLTDRLTIRCL